jgi:4-alpha-glucanotransferase
MQWPRGAGVLLHPTSLPGPFGIGDLGPAAERFLDFLVEGGQTVWQVLPIGPSGLGNSPYSSVSAFAGNPMLISPERLVEDGLLTRAEILTHPAFPDDRVDYAAVTPWKMSLLRRAFNTYRARREPRSVWGAFETFRAEQHDWLDDYALFAALHDERQGMSWTEWEPGLARREPKALATARQRLEREIMFHAFVQFLFARQWERIRSGARTRNVRMLGDLAIFVAHQSADVWAHPDIFLLDAEGNSTVVSGVPPDYFSSTGQLWGTPLYDWAALRRTRYSWWIARARRAFALHDAIRLDHFRGFEAYWEVPGDAETAAEGRWAPGPGAAFFEAMQDDLGGPPILAEDLGQITPEVHALRRRFGFPGMRVLQFGFGGDAGSHHLPHNFAPDSVVYTGTHDNDTTRGWFASSSRHQRRFALRYLHTDAVHVVPAMIRCAYASVAALAVVPLQDVLQLGSEARMNVPSRPTGNWEWRFTGEQLTPAASRDLARLAALYGR